MSRDVPVGAGVSPVGPETVTAYPVALHYPPGRMPDTHPMVGYDRITPKTN